MRPMQQHHTINLPRLTPVASVDICVIPALNYASSTSEEARMSVLPALFSTSRRRIVTVRCLSWHSYVRSTMYFYTGTGTFQEVGQRVIETIDAIQYLKNANGGQ